MRLTVDRDSLNEYIMAFICVFPFIRIDGIQIMNYIIYSSSVLIVLVVIIHFIANKVRSDYKLTTYIIIYVFLNVLSTVLGSGYVFSSIALGIRLISFVSIMQIYLNAGDYIIIKIFDKYLTLLIFISIFFQFYDQDLFGLTDSLNHMNFFVSDNYMPFVYIPYTTIVIFNHYLFGDKIFVTIFKIIVCYVSIIKGFSVNAVLTYSTLLLLCIIVLIPKLDKLLYIVGGVGFISALIYNNGLYHLDNYIFMYTGKTISHARSRIWLAAIDNFLKRPVIGYGIGDNGRLRINLVGGKIWFSHNLYLEILLQGGVIQFTVYLFIIIMCLTKIIHCEDSMLKRLTVCTFVSLCIANMAEGTPSDPLQFIILILMYYFPELLNEANGFLNQKDERIIEINTST